MNQSLLLSQQDRFRLKYMCECIRVRSHFWLKPVVCTSLPRPLVCTSPFSFLGFLAATRVHVAFRLPRLPRSLLAKPWCTLVLPRLPCSLLATWRTLVHMRQHPCRQQHQSRRQHRSRQQRRTHTRWRTACRSGCLQKHRATQP